MLGVFINASSNGPVVVFQVKSTSLLHNRKYKSGLGDPDSLLVVGGDGLAPE